MNQNRIILSFNYLYLCIYALSQFSSTNIEDVINGNSTGKLKEARISEKMKFFAVLKQSFLHS